MSVRFLCTVVPVLLVSACAPNLQIVDAPGSYQTTVNPSVGVISEVSVGDTMIDEQHSLSSPAIRFLQQCKYSLKHTDAGSPFLNYDIPQGAIYAQENVTNGVPGYCGSSSMEMPPFGSGEQHLCVAESAGRLVGFPGSYVAQSDCQVENTTSTQDAVDNIKKEILYDGRSGSTIRLSYREFSEDMARPAFTQELSYDIASDNTVGFRGARFEIISAGNSSIKYRIISGF